MSTWRGSTVPRDCPAGTQVTPRQARSLTLSRPYADIPPALVENALIEPAAGSAGPLARAVRAALPER